MKVAVEALPIAAALAIVAAALGWLVDPWAALTLLPLLLFVAWFFRDPERSAPSEPNALLSPADGRVLKADPHQISVFMNLFDVHVCRAPVAGSVVDVEHLPGRFLAAYKDSASEHNERASIRLSDGEREVTFTLVAGLIARRIVCKVRAGQRLRAGERVGLIRFGSRVDVAMPAGSRPLVRVGDRVLAGESVLARLPDPAGVRDAD